LANLGGSFYFVIAVLLGGFLVHFAIRLWRQGGNRQAWGMYRYSSTYLALIFIALVADTLFFA
jgi:protoheme IX farnesyltransferase